MTPAERMRAYRKRKRDAELKSIRRWEPEEGSGKRRFSGHRILDARSRNIFASGNKYSNDHGLK